MEQNRQMLCRIGRRGRRPTRRSGRAHQNCVHCLHRRGQDNQAREAEIYLQPKQVQVAKTLSWPSTLWKARKVGVERMGAECRGINKEAKRQGQEWQDPLGKSATEPPSARPERWHFCTELKKQMWNSSGQRLSQRRQDNSYALLWRGVIIILNSFLGRS